MTTSTKNILIIEDNTDLSKLLSSQLVNTSTAVHNARTGEEGLAQINSIKPDIIVLDLSLPKMRGDEMLGKLYAANPAFNTPVIVLSNTADVELVDKLEKMPNLTFLAKSEQDFHSVVKIILEKIQVL